MWTAAFDCRWCRFPREWRCLFLSSCCFDWALLIQGFSFLSCYSVVRPPSCSSHMNLLPKNPKPAIPASFARRSQLTVSAAIPFIYVFHQAMVSSINTQGTMAEWLTRQPAKLFPSGAGVRISVVSNVAITILVFIECSEWVFLVHVLRKLLEEFECFVSLCVGHWIQVGQAAPKSTQ